MPSLFEVSLNESVQVLKRVLPLMSKQRVPTIPQNYTIWYDFVAERNEALATELQYLIDMGSGFSPELCRRIYEKYYLDEIRNEVDGIQEAVREAVESMLAMYMFTKSNGFKLISAGLPAPSMTTKSYRFIRVAKASSTMGKHRF